jgi:phage/conjugal plasmid C-4 type zinc finger TraR family protein
MDEVDRAQREETAYLQAAIAAALPAAGGVEQLLVDGVIVCAECGEPIPLARLAALPSACRCVVCQAEAEGWPC